MRRIIRRIISMILIFALIISNVQMDAFAMGGLNTSGQILSTLDPDMPNEEYVGQDRTNHTELLSLAFEKWWYGAAKTQIEISGVEDENEDLLLVDYADSESWTTATKLGTSLKIKAGQVTKGDYFTVRIEEPISDMKLQDNFTSESISWDFKTLSKEAGDEMNGTQITVTFLQDGPVTTELPLEFSLQSEKLAFVRLQDKASTGARNEKYVIATPNSAAAMMKLLGLTLDETGEGTVEGENENSSLGESGTTSGDGNNASGSGTEAGSGTENGGNVVILDPTEKFSVFAQLEFNEKTSDGRDWKSLIRPLEFNQPIKLVATYTGDDGLPKTKTFYAQENMLNENFALLFVYDGNGGGYFEIANVPKVIQTEEGLKEVTGYQISVDTQYPYYKSSVLEVSELKDNMTISTIRLDVVAENFKVMPVAEGDSTTTEFPYTAVFTNPYVTDETETTEATVVLKSTNTTPVTVGVPAGLQYTATQAQVVGYKFQDKYTIDEERRTGLSETEYPDLDLRETTGAATGSIHEGYSTVITSVNVSRNISYPITVEWADNSSQSRPEVTEDFFCLKYQLVTPEGVTEWKEFTEEDKALFDMEDMPSFDTTNKLDGQFYYRGLPGMDTEGNTVHFIVEPKNIPDSYVCEIGDENHSFKYSEIVNFRAYISWLDSNDAGHIRPNLEDYKANLHLYRRVAEGKYEELDAEAAGLIFDGYTVKINQLPRYNDLNQEYDYVVVQGTITDAEGVDQVNHTSIPNYQTFYNNGYGNYGNDTELCHNGGVIRQLAKTTAEFNATKIWKDDEESAKNRPDVTLTLWRFTIGAEVDVNTIDIDDYFAKASRVTYRKWIGSTPVYGEDGKLKEMIQNYENILVSYTLKSNENQNEYTIHFDSTTVSGLPTYYELPLYDTGGNQYVYFVRETLESEDYDVSYSDGVKAGAENGGKVINTRKEKAAVNVNKLWQSPSDMANVDGTSIVYDIYAPLKDGDGSYKRLTVYSSEQDSYKVLSDTELTTERTDALTQSGFSTTISSLDKVFYVNIYDADGQPYDMERAFIKEVKILKKNGENVEEIPVVYDSDRKGSFELEGNLYTTATAYLTPTTTSEGLQQFNYKETNTITGTVDYKVTKSWSSTISNDEYHDVQSVVIKVSRQSTKEGAVRETIAQYGVIPEGTSPEQWVIPDPDVANTVEQRSWTKILEGLPKYDEQGYRYQYYVDEQGFYLTDGSYLSISDARKPENRKWSVDTYRYDDSTTIVNYHYTESGQYFHMEKEWTDNGDSSDRKTVYVRIYKRQDLLRALNTLAADATYQEEGAMISLSLLNDVPYYATALTTKNVWQTNVSVNTIEKAIQNRTTDLTVAENKAVNMNDYITLEYQSENASNPDYIASYSFAELLEAAQSTGRQYSITGRIRNSGRQYQVIAYRDEGSATARFENKRIGQVEMTIDKAWFDENNINETRDHVSFRILQDGEPYLNVTGVTVTGEGVSFDAENGIVTISVNENNKNLAHWGATIQDLPLFSDMGSQFTYNLEEIEIEADDYSSVKGDIVVEETGVPDSLVYKFSFSNTIAGYVSHTVYKFWNDLSTGGAERPDISFDLYRYLRCDAEMPQNVLKKPEQLDSYVLFKDYKDQQWIAGSQNHETGDYEQGYDWKVVVNNLPKYDAIGREYVYVFHERIGNYGENVYGTYETKEVQKTVTDPVTGDAVTYEVVTNTITDQMTISGDKVWNGISRYYPRGTDYAAELPSPQIVLYRSETLSSLPQEITETEVAALVAAGTITQVNITSLENEKFSFSFPDKTTVSSEDLAKGYIVQDEDGNYMLPKFNENGKRYYYIVYERLMGISDALYTKLSAGGTLNNEFRTDVNRREIDVEKTWTGRDILIDAEKKYPSVTFSLYRYERGADPDTALLMDEKVIKADWLDPTKDNVQKVKEEKKAASDWFTRNENGSFVCKFKDLLIYSPSGKEYCYYVKENSVSGYSVQYQDDSENSSTAYADVVQLPENPFSGETNITTIGTTNSYDDPGNIVISGQKLWNDYNNNAYINGTRPDGIDVTLKRYTQNESGQTNKVDAVTIDLLTLEEESATETKPYIIWYKAVDGNPNKWSYRIYNLERYAPNGMPYVYSLKEEAVAGYKQQDKPVEATANSNSITMTSLTNSFNASYKVRKNWQDGSNKYGLRPDSVTVVLQRSADGGVTFENIGWEESCAPLPSEMEGEVKLADGTTVTMPIVSKKLTAANVMANTKNNSWQYTFTNLPEYVPGTNVKWTYRCVEAKIGNADIEGCFEEKTSYKAGAYTCTYTTRNDSTTEIQNKLEDTSLYVKKIWKDADDYTYFTRPDSLTFKLQMRGVKPEAAAAGEEGEKGEENSYEEGDGALGDWQDVKLANGKAYTFTLSEANNWETTLKDLPVAVVGADGKTYYNLFFRAVEVHAETNPDRADTAQNYADLTSYETVSADHQYVNDNSRNESKVTNQLITSPKGKKITVKKVWNRDPGTELTAVFELLYRTEDEDPAVWHCFGDSDPCDLGAENGCMTVHSTGAGCQIRESVSTESKTEEFVWDDLPAYDKQGKKMIYKVVEAPISGYRTEIETETADGAEYPTDYVFTNIELRSFEIEKTWVHTADAEKAAEGYTSKFELLYQIEGETDWHCFGDALRCTSGGADGCRTTHSEEDGCRFADFTSTTLNDTTTYTWTGLPKFNVDGKEITYRANEVEINGVPVADATNNSYVVSYSYGDDRHSAPGFNDVKGYAENRMVYGFVNLSKAAAFLNPNVTDADRSLAGVTFDIYQGTGEDKQLYIEGIPTNADGQLVCNADGTYGTGAAAKYLVSGSYTIVEHEPLTSYSKWNQGVSFTVGMQGGSVDTGEHGTAWIYTETLGSQMALRVAYIHAENAHAANEAEPCKPQTKADTQAFNLESRGVLQFTKEGEEGAALNTHDGSTGESKAYFGVFLEPTCETQVAGMEAAAGAATAQEKTTMVLSTRGQDGSDKKAQFTAVTKDISGKLPYLREDANGLLTLLSGTYYLKEMTAPAGYILDETVRKVVVEKITETAIGESLDSVYQGNEGQIMALADETGDVDYAWSNTENAVLLYKKDQFGRNVKLKEGEYLVLSTASGTFMTGENQIRLYQNADKPAAKKDGTAFETGREPEITYDASEGTWLIRGLFDIDRTFTLSEPQTAVPANFTQAADFVFTMGTDGAIEVEDTLLTAEAKEAPLDVTGLDYNNYYKAASDENIVVLRDPARFLKDVALNKIDSTTETGIQYISFELYKYELDAEGKMTNIKAVLPAGTVLTTDAAGKIELNLIDESVVNQITNCSLKNGLDVGYYYFHEVEQGASDIYRLADDILFEVKPKQSVISYDGTEECADLQYVITDHVTQAADNKTGILKNDPVVTEPKTLELSKVNQDAATEKLEGAIFTLEYISINDGQDGQHVTTIYDCITGTDGKLYLTDADGNATTTKPDISKKGNYVLTELLAPQNYMTKTGTGSNIKQPVSMLTFSVDSNNTITNIVKDPLVTKAEIVTSETTVGEKTITEQTGLDVVVNNEKSVVTIQKLSDLYNLTKTADQKNTNGSELNGAKLSIYEGVDTSDSSKKRVEWTTGTTTNPYDVAQGTLKELTVYTLHEESAPVGYLAADDITFMLYGTVQDGENLRSRLYVWTGAAGAATIDLENDAWKTNTSWSDVRNLKAYDLVMIDEAIIAPVDLQKVVGKAGEGYQLLPGALFEVTSLDGNVKLGTAESGTNGYLVWKSITAEGYAKNCIYNNAGKRVTASDASSVIGKSIVLQQNTAGYTVKEISSPDHAFNQEQTLTFKVTEANYLAYKKGAASYHTTDYVDMNAADQASDKTAAALKTRDAAANSSDYVNPPFEATFELSKYDMESADLTDPHDLSKIGLSGVEFTLSKKDGTDYTKVGDYTTGENGLLSIPISEKGEYRLVEKTPKNDGYQLNEKEMLFTIVNEDYRKTLTYSEETENTLHTKVIKDRDLVTVGDGKTYELPNERKHGSLTLTKLDADTNEKLNGVQYRLVRTTPAVNSLVDQYFPSADVSNLTLETGKTYGVIASANTEAEITAGTSDTSASAPGILKVEDLQWGTYSIQEIRENAGYILSNIVYTFTIDADNLEAGIVDVDQNIVTNTKNQVKIEKKDLTNHSLDGGRFELHKVTTVNTDLVMATQNASYFAAKTSQNPTNAAFTADTTIYGLEKGTYVLREILAPQGYELAKDVIFSINEFGVVSDVTTCTVNKAGNVITKDASGESVVSLSTSGTGVTVKNTLTVKDTPIEVSLTKTLLNGATGTATALAVNDERGNAEYDITGQFANEASVTTKHFTGNTIRDDLKAKLVGGRTYKIVETKSPAGYEITNTAVGAELTISVGTDGTITVITGTNQQDETVLTADNTGADGIAALVYQDQPIEITLKKIVAGGTEIDEADLGKAVFTLSGKLVSEDGTKVEAGQTVTGLTTENFTSKLCYRLIAEEEYTVTETHAPDGYKLTPAFSIKIDPYGEIYTRKGSTGDWVNATTKTDVLSVINEPNSLTLKKTDDNGTLAGATFEITPVDAGDRFVNMTAESRPANVTPKTEEPADTGWTDKVIRITTTDAAAGLTLTGHFVAGVQYRLHETERVYYHEIMEQDILFHITDLGLVVIDQNSSIPNNSGVDAAVIGSDNMSLTIQNPIIKGTVVLKKYYRDSSSDAAVYDDAHLLPNAVYTLTQTKNADGTDVEVSKQTVKTDAKTSGAEGFYQYNENGTVSRFVTDANGAISMKGLPEGTYYFSEVDAPKAYHINDEALDRIEFRIIEAETAHVILPREEDKTAGNLMDTRVNASISLTKLSEGAALPGTVFEVQYSETETGTYRVIGRATTDASGKAVFSQGVFADGETAEGLRRGFYKLVEIKAENQMLNKADGTRNTIFFEIGNEIDREYKVDADLQTYLTAKGLKGVTITNGEYIRLERDAEGNAVGITNTPIPTKKVTVKKIWKDDAGLIQTFRPEKVTVQLYRTYKNGTKTAVGIPVELRYSEDADHCWTYEWTNLPAYVDIQTGDADTYETRLYTYTVEETDIKNWYIGSYLHSELSVTQVFEQNTKDQGTESDITNTLTGGSSKQKLRIYKTLGGGSENDTFYVRVKLTKNGEAVGNTGYYLDTYDVKRTADGSVISDDKAITDAAYWMEFKGNQYIEIELPGGVTYSVEEKMTDGDTYAAASTLEYTPRYDAKQSGTIAQSAVDTTIRNAVHKSLNLTKLDENGDPQSGAVFEITYTPLTGGNAVGSSWTKQFTASGETGKVGKLFDTEGNPIDLTLQGTYQIEERKAKEHYNTLTDNSGSSQVLATITVSALDVMTITKGAFTDLVTAAITDDGSKATVTVKNELTKVRIGKTIDYANGESLSDAELAVYEMGPIGADYSEAAGTLVDQWTTTAENHIVTKGLRTAGVLQEGMVYKLHETENSAPAGYLEAKDVYFILNGTYRVAGTSYSRIVMTNASGTPLSAAAQNSKGTTYNTAGVLSAAVAADGSIAAAEDGVLKLADAGILVPVDLKKVLNLGENDTALQDVEFTIKDKDTGILMGTGVTNSDGYLVWKEIRSDAYTKKLIYTKGTFNAAGECVTSSSDSSKVIGKTIILKQNTNGYEITESYAPDNAYNDSRSFTVNPKDSDFTAYLAANDLLLNIKNGLMETLTGGFAANSGTVENEKYTSTVKLHKYDADEEAALHAIAGTEFTLYKATVNGSTWTKGAVVNDAYKHGETTANTSGVYTTDSNGDILIDIPKKGYYILEETKATVGYQLDAADPPSFMFMLVDDDTKETEPADGSYRIFGYNETGSEVNEIKQDAEGVPNDRLTGSVSLTKKDSGTNAALNGVVFTISRKFTKVNVTEHADLLLYEPMDIVTGKTYTAVKNAAGTWGWNVTDGTAGVVSVKGLNWDEYEIVEKTELTGYVKSDAVYSFEIKASDRTKLVADTPTAAPKYVVNAKNEVILHKTDVLDAEVGNAEEKDLSGAVFEIHEGDGDTCTECTAVAFYSSRTAAAKVTTVTSGADGTIRIYGLPTELTTDGTNAEKVYHLVETTAPKGYRIAAPVTFTIDRYGKLKSVTKTSGVEVKTEVTEVRMQDEPIKIYIDKIGMSNTDRLEDARFTLTDVCAANCDHKLADGTTKVENITTDDTGHVMIPIEKVVAGHTYKLEETKAPDGYKCTAVVTFTVDSDGKATLSAEGTSGGYIGKDLNDAATDIKTAEVVANRTLKISNEKISLKLVKQDHDDAAIKLKGVTFTMEPATGSDSFVEKYVTDHPDQFTDGRLTLVTGEDGEVKIPLDLVKHDHSYIITETDLGTNLSYRLAKEAEDRRITVKVEKDGTLTVTTGQDMFGSDPADPSVIQIKNEQIKLEISKLDQAQGTALAGVTLKLSKLDTEGTTWKPVVQTGVTDAEGKWVTGADPVAFTGTDFTPGTYKLEEVAWPENYNRVEKELVFTVDQTGKISTVKVGDETEETITGANWTDAVIDNYDIENPVDGKAGKIELQVTNAKFTDLKLSKVGSENNEPIHATLSLSFLDGEEWKYVSFENGAVKTTDHKVVAGAGEEGASLSTDDAGTAIFKNLPDGIYRLHETKTDTGYNLLSSTIIVEINRNTMQFYAYSGSEISASADKTELSLDETDHNMLLMTVINKKGMELPKTGGTTPRLPISVLPIVALLEGLVLYIYQSDGRRRKRKVRRAFRKEVM